MAKRRRIGLLLPCTNQTLEPDFYRVAPREVTIHTERMWSPLRKAPGGVGGDHLREMNADIERAARYAARPGIELAVYGCTSGSFLEGSGFDQQVISRIQKEAGVPAIATSTAAVEALRHLGLRRLSVATPYGDWINHRLKIFLEAAGFQVLNVDGEPTVKNSLNSADIGDQDPEVILKFVPTVVRPEADGVFLSCTAWRTVEVVDQLEQKLGKPVVTSNQATIWLALRRLGITTPIDGFGRLFRTPAPVTA